MPSEMARLAADDAVDEQVLVGLVLHDGGAGRVVEVASLRPRRSSRGRRSDCCRQATPGPLEPSRTDNAPMVHPPSARSDSTGTVGSIWFWPRLPSRSGITAAAIAGAAGNRGGGASRGSGVRRGGRFVGAVSVSDDVGPAGHAAPSVAMPSTATMATAKRRAAALVDRAGLVIDVGSAWR